MEIDDLTMFDLATIKLGDPYDRCEPAVLTLENNIAEVGNNFFTIEDSTVTLLPTRPQQLGHHEVLVVYTAGPDDVQKYPISS
jgi:hypothetical protein